MIMMFGAGFLGRRARNAALGVGTLAAAAVAVTMGISGPPTTHEIDLNATWEPHYIAAGSATLDGSDGVDFADLDGDGDLDVVSGHEQSHKVNVSLNPGFSGDNGSPWPTVVLPATQNVTGPEDAIFGDVDGDGWKDVIVGAEGGTRIWVIFSPTSAGSLLTASAWTRVEVTASVGTRWMKLVLIDIDENGTLDIVAGGKEGSSTDATISYFSSATPRTAASWTESVVAPSGWVMSLYVRDVDADGDLDIVYSDRETIDNPSLDSSKLGVRWYESNGAATPSWTAHQISAVSADFHFISLTDFDGDGDTDVLACRANSGGLNESFLYKNAGSWASWTTVSITQPSNVGACQDVQPADLDGDGATDLVFTYSGADGSLEGLVWLHNTGTNASPTWERGTLDGSLGVKYDNAVIMDIDGDGDLDVVSSEQHADTDSDADVGPGLGVVWYENPRS